MTKSELRGALVKALNQLDEKWYSIPEEFTLYSNLDRGRVKYKNNRIWNFDLNIDYHEGENIVFFDYKGNEEPGININFPSIK